MPQRKARPLCKATDKSLPILTRSVNSWKQAILAANKALDEAEARVSHLKRAVAAFRAMQEAGDPWPGTSESENRLLGQEGDLGQS
jgi:hypothetical protein